ncbi:serine/threonine-protein phosphatase 4 catalytic subunit, partial [Schistosoma bovis]
LNRIDFICRAHQLVMEGYRWHFHESVLTVWSAPNYCYRCGNVAAILRLNERLDKEFSIFEAAPQGFILDEIIHLSFAIDPRTQEATTTSTLLSHNLRAVKICKNHKFLHLMLMAKSFLNKENI